MKIGILSDTRLPTDIAYPGHGLGRSLARIAIGLAKRGHDVTLYGGLGSKVDGCAVVEDAHEDQRAYAMVERKLDYDVMIDGSHHFGLARLRDDIPMVCKVADGEGKAPRCRVYGEKTIPLYFGMQEPGEVIIEGVDVENIPFVPGSREAHLLWIGLKAAAYHKRPEIAVEVAKKAGHPIWLMGDGADLPLEADAQPKAKSGAGFYAELARAYGTITITASMSALEAAATGTPTVSMLPGDEWVEDGVSGFVVDSEEAAVEAVGKLGGLDQRKMRQWVEAERGLGKMAAEWERVLERAANGERW